MFDFVRNNKRVMQGLLLVIIVPSFVFVGVESYQNRDGDAGVAEVDGRKITQLEWEDAQRRQIDQARQMMGEQFDQKMFDTPEAKRTVLDNLVAERAVDAELTRSGITVGDAVLQKTILDIQQFRKPDGTFDMEGYTAALAAQGMTPAMFDQRLRRDLAIQQLAGAVQMTAFMPRTVAGRLSDINDQEREVQEVLFPLAAYMPRVQVTDAMVKAYYEKNAAQFQIPEQVKAEYVVFDGAAVERTIEVSDAEVKDYYDKNASRFSRAEQRYASHILINAPASASDADKAKAKQAAQAVLAEVRANPGNFAAIAKARSQDPGSAGQGGDLGLVERGMMVPAFEEAVFALNDGAVSDLVQTEFGYHIIKIDRIVPGAKQPLEAVRDDIVAEVKKQKTAAKYAELAEVFSNTSYEQADSLKPVADKLKLQVQQVDGLTRKPNPALGAEPFNNEKFLTALFSVDSIKNKRNTEAVEVAPSVLISGRVLELRPASKRPLAEVEGEIRQRVQLEEATRLAREAGEAKLKAAKASGSADGFGGATIVSRTKQPEIATAAAIAVLKADVTKLPAYVGVDIPGQGYGVYRIGKVAQPATPDVERRKQEATAISGIAGQAQMFDYIEALKVKSKAKINVKERDLGLNRDAE